MNRNDRGPITTSFEPNPLRPYYIPPSISDSTYDTFTRSSGPSLSSGRNAKLPGGPSRGSHDLIPGFDIDIRSSANEAWTNTRALLDTLAWRYASTLMAQPFDVTKVILQVAAPDGSAAKGASTKRKTSRKRSSKHGETQHRRERAYGAYSETDDGDDDYTYDRSEDDDIPEYFSSAAPRSMSPRRRRRTPSLPSESPDPTPTPSRANGQRNRSLEEEYRLDLKQPDSITNVIGELNRTSGALGLWRATNCTFLYSILLRTTDSFIRSLLLALLGLPEILGPEQGGLAPGLMTGNGSGSSGIDLFDSPNPLASLFVVGLASCATGVLLAPLDLIRTRLVVAPTILPPRGLISNIRRLPSLLVPSMLWIPTGLYHTVPNVISASLPLLFRSQLRITPDNSPGGWSLVSFSTALVELFIRLPLETVLRRAQVKTLKVIDSSFPFIVATAPYTGVMGTVYSIMYTEGETRTKDAKGMVKIRKGQGLAGLLRGWRIGFWGLVGIWAAGALSPVNESRRREF